MEFHEFRIGATARKPHLSLCLNASAQIFVCKQSIVLVKILAARGPGCAAKSIRPSSCINDWVSSGARHRFQVLWAAGCAFDQPEQPNFKGGEN
jgi:hypothetical protein